MRKLICFLFVIFILNCGPSIQVARLDNVQRGPTADNIEVYTDRNNIKRPYKEIALLTVEESDFGNNDQEMLDSLVSRAKQIGANAIILLSQETQSEGGYIYTTSKNKKKTSSSTSHYVESKRKVMRASAIVYEEEQ